LNLPNIDGYEACDYPIGVNEIAVLLDVKPATVSQWGVRKNLPPIDAMVSGGSTKLWRIETILNWASSTGRNRKDVKNCEEALVIVITKAYDEVKTLMNETYSRWDSMAKEWNNYRREQGLEPYELDVDSNIESIQHNLDDLGSYTTGEEE